MQQNIIYGTRWRTSTHLNVFISKKNLAMYCLKKKRNIIILILCILATKLYLINAQYIAQPYVAEHLQACVSSKPINFLNASCFRRISGRKFRTSSKTMQDDVSEPHSHACDFAEVRRSRLQQRQNLKLLKLTWERRRLKCVMNDAASPWSRFGGGFTVHFRWLFCFLNQKTHAGSSKSSLLLPPPQQQKKEVQRLWSWKWGRITSLMSFPMLVPLFVCFLPHISGHML